MKAVLKVSEKTNYSTFINVVMSPFEIIEDIYHTNKQVVMSASRNNKVIKGMELGIIDSKRSFFTLIDSKGNYIEADWYVPIKYQSEVAKELETLKTMNIIPMFLVSIYGFEDDDSDSELNENNDSFYKSYYYLERYLLLDDYDFDANIIDHEELIGEFNINSFNKVKIILSDLMACYSWVSEFSFDIEQ